MIDNKKLNQIIKESIDKVVNEEFEQGATLESIIMKLYDFGAELNLDKNAREYSVRGIGGVIMSACQKMMELLKKRPVNIDFQKEYSKKSSEYK